LAVVEWQKFKGPILSPCEGACQLRACARAFLLALSVKSTGHTLRCLLGSSLPPANPSIPHFASGQSETSGASHRTARQSTPLRRKPTRVQKRGALNDVGTYPRSTAPNARVTNVTIASASLEFRWKHPTAVIKVDDEDVPGR
jgi:hypothetical protein